MIKNNRVMAILDLIDKFKVCDVTHVARLFYAKNKFNIQDAQRKMNALVNDKTLKRKRNDINSRYYYWIGKEPDQVRHKLSLTELYVKFIEKYGNCDMQLEYTGISGMRPDAFIKVKSNNRQYMYFVEVHLSNNPFDIEKYERSYMLKPFGEDIFPIILVITDKKVNLYSKLLNFKILDTKIEL